jgi:transcriptional regulator with XRE-family HTH domain
VPSASDYRAILGATIRQQRTRAGFTIEGLAEKADLHPNYLGRVERGEEHVSVSALIRIAKALHIRVRELFAEV